MARIDSRKGWGKRVCVWSRGPLSSQRVKDGKGEKYRGERGPSPSTFLWVPKLSFTTNVNSCPCAPVVNLNKELL